MTNKIDFKKTLPSYKAPRGRFELIDVPTLQYLAIDGHGDPNTSPDYADALSALYPVAYQLKSMSKKLGQDYVVPPLEGLWWADNPSAFQGSLDKSKWDWTSLIMVPDWLNEEQVKAAITAVERKKSLPRLTDIRLLTLEEGSCVQTLHVGSFDDEGPVLATMHNEFIPTNGLKPSGKHHEIYFSDFRKVAPEKLRTLLRQPVIAV